MADIFDPVWAESDTAVITTPSADEIAQGFQCGPADPGLFNWLFQSMMSALNTVAASATAFYSRRINTTAGLTGGGTLENDLTLSLAFNTLEFETAIANDDLVAIWDTSLPGMRAMTRSDFLAGVGGGGGAITGGANIGGGPGEVFASISGGNLQFRTLVNAGGTVIAVAGNTVTVALADRGADLTFA